MAKNRGLKSRHQSEQRIHTAVGNEPQYGEIAALAYRLWEEGGRREGCADEDWFRAEQIASQRRGIALVSGSVER